MPRQAIDALARLAELAERNNQPDHALAALERPSSSTPTPKPSTSTPSASTAGSDTATPPGLDFRRPIETYRDSPPPWILKLGQPESEQGS